ncbi:hypothetical protein F5878DRAFT_407290 [Lentinula raphanica]|uniref:Uncharacterized protein n=1 Tax=Lentinula raphanica TaxID=153919 RepID=A0AA38UHT6_9AGAR|nr:hypothetical protein F5878DRAFT_407290 [Lentinula raphanica]
MFSISKRPAVARTPTRSEQVRALWVDFELWHASQLQEIENKIKTALKDLDQKWRSNKSRKPKKDSKELEEEKAKTRSALENTLDGNTVRQEWHRRITEAGLANEDWVDMTDEEQRKVEKILGADLEFEEDLQPRSSESYAVVDPSSFHPLDDAWLEVKHNLRNDDQLSLDASISSSSSTSEAWNTPAYALWSSEASRSSAQSSQTSSPEWHSNKHLASDLSSAPSSRPSTSTSLSSHTRSKSHGIYIGPDLTSDTDDEETSFEKWKRALRIQKIREFHDDAADADIQLTLDIDEARRTKSWSKEDEAQRLRAHEVAMLALRERKETERKAAVEAERQRRRAELRQQLPTERDYASKAQKFLKSLQTERESTSVSDTPTIRQSAFGRAREHSLSHLQQQEWPESGNDTPTPTARSSAWHFKKESAGTTASTLGEAPLLKRLATAPASVTSMSGMQSSHSSAPTGEKVSTGAPKVAPMPTSEPAVQDSQKKTVAAADASANVAVSSANKKSKKEKDKGKEKEKEKEQSSAKTDKKANSLAVERKDSNVEASQNSISMPGQWGWGDSTLTSSSAVPAAVANKPSSASTISILSSNPSTTAIPAASSTSSHSSPYSYPYITPLTSNTALPAHSFSAPPPQASLPTAGASLPQTHSSHTHAIPDNRRVWIPPTLESSSNKNTKVKQSNPNSLEVPTAVPTLQIQKALSGPGNVASSTDSGASAPGMLGVPHPTQIQKSVSGPPDLRGKVESTLSPLPAAVPASTGRQASQSGGGNREAQNAKPETSKATTNPPSSVPSTKPANPSASTTSLNSITSSSAPTTSTSSGSSKKKSKGKKKVTIEEAQDEEAGSGPSQPLKEKGIERLPVDSRYIIEPITEPEAPKPVVSEPQAQEMYKEIFEYKVPEAPSISASASTSSVTTDDLNQRNNYNFWSPSAVSTAVSSSSSLPLKNEHERWIPPNGAIHQSYSSSISSLPQHDQHERWLPSESHESLARQDKQKTVRWTPSAYAYDAPDASVGDEQQDSFLTILNSMQAVLTGGIPDNLPSDKSAASGSTGKRENTKKAQGRGRSESTTDESFWQHAMASLGRGGSGIPAASAI